VSRHANRIVVIGGSAGALPALLALIEQLPGALSASVLVVIHTRVDRKGALPGILNRVSRLPVAFADDGDEPVAGRIYIARPAHYLSSPAAQS
jgi:two-component system chemotaxis response regulator CheB